MNTAIEYAHEFKSFSGRMFSVEFGNMPILEVAKYGLGRSFVVSGVGNGPPFDSQVEYDLLDEMDYVYGSTDREFFVSKTCSACGEKSREWLNKRVTVDQVSFGAIGKNPIVRYVDMPEVVVMTTALIAMLEDANFTGFRRLPFVWKGPPEEEGNFGAIEVVGKTACGKLRVTGPNRCPFCEKGVLMCSECGTIHWTCKECGEETACFEHVEDRGRRIVRPRQPVPDTIFDPRGWDGSDLSRDHGFIAASPRLVKWLVERNVGPFSACPIRVGATGVDPEQLKRVAQMDADI
jgi:hypothetical protein